MNEVFALNTWLRSKKNVSKSNHSIKVIIKLINEALLNSLVEYVKKLY